MRGLILAGVAAAALATPALATEQQFVCHGQASGARGERVDASIHLTPKGARLASYSSWDPPRSEGPVTATTEAPDLSFTISYNSAGANGIGPAGNGLIMVMAFAPPGKRGSASPDRLLAGLAVEATVDAGAPRALPLVTNAMIEDLPMTALRQADLPELPASARLVTLRLTDRKHQQIALVRYDLSDSASRDRLFATAWQAAEEAARNPDRCEATAESD